MSRNWCFNCCSMRCNPKTWKSITSKKKVSIDPTRHCISTSHKNKKKTCSYKFNLQSYTSMYFHIVAGTGRYTTSTTNMYHTCIIQTSRTWSSNDCVRTVAFSSFLFCTPSTWLSSRPLTFNLVTNSWFVVCNSVTKCRHCFNELVSAVTVVVNTSISCLYWLICSTCIAAWARACSSRSWSWCRACRASFRTS